MGISMDNLQTTARRHKSSLIKKYAAILIGALSIAGLFLPVMNIQLTANPRGGTMQVHTFSLNFFQILSGKVQINNTFAYDIPFCMKLILSTALIACAAGILLLFLKKPIPSGVLFLSGAILNMILMVMMNNIRTDLNSIRIDDKNLEQLFGFFKNGISVVPSTGWTFFLAGCILCAFFAIWSIGGEKLAESIFFVAATISIGAVLLITFYMINEGAPGLFNMENGGIIGFLFGTEWNMNKNQFGIVHIVLGSVFATFGAIVIGVPIGLLTAVFLAELAPKKLAAFIRPAIELLAGIPSVVYGFFGISVIIPTLLKIFPDQFAAVRNGVGDSLFAVILVLAIMILPTIINITETSLRAVPASYKEASLALGNTHIGTIFKILIPAAKSGILSGVILGVGRAIGETMAILLVAGNIAGFPQLFKGTMTLTTTLAQEFSYASEAQKDFLYAVGLVLFVFTMIVNIAFTIISKRGVQMDENK